MLYKINIKRRNINIIRMIIPMLFIILLAIGCLIYYFISICDYKEVEIKEGYYILDMDKYESSEIPNGNISVIKDYKEVPHINICIDISGEQIYRDFVWDDLHGVYKEINGDNYYFNFMEKKGKLFGNLQDRNKQNDWIFSIKKINYYNGINITLAVRQYFIDKEDDIQYVFKTSNFQVLYNEEYMIPVYQITDGKPEELYTVMVSNQSSNDVGNARIYLSEDIKSLINGEKKYKDLEVLEEFNVYEMYDFE